MAFLAIRQDVYTISIIIRGYTKCLVRDVDDCADEALGDCTERLRRPRRAASLMRVFWSSHASTASHDTGCFVRYNLLLFSSAQLQYLFLECHVIISCRARRKAAKLRGEDKGVTTEPNRYGLNNKSVRVRSSSVAFA